MHRYLTAGQRDRREAREQAAYDALYDEIEARLIDEEIADGADEDYKPSGARVHALVEMEMKRSGGDDD